MAACSRFFWLPFVVLLASCVTINIYFPAAAAEKAADRIIDEVWGEEADAPEIKDAPGKPGQSSIGPVRPWRLAAVSLLLHGLVGEAHAQQADIDISTPPIRGIETKMKTRHEQLEPFYQAGNIGVTSNGLVGVRDATGVALNQRASLNRLVAEENRDRDALYREIARANGHPEWESEIRATFARRWVDRAGQRGWWYQDPQGNWKH